MLGQVVTTVTDTKLYRGDNHRLFRTIYDQLVWPLRSPVNHLYPSFFIGIV